MPPERSNNGQSHIDVRMWDDLAGNVLDGNERLTANGVLSIDDDDLDTRTFDYHLETQGGSFEIEDGGFEDIDWEEHLDEIKEIAASDDPIGILVDSLAPQLSRDAQLEQIMTALVLQLVGAGRKDLDDGPTFRGDFHILVLSDPGMGKSELLGEVEDLSPIGKYVSGKGLSKAGATAAAVADDFRRLGVHAQGRDSRPLERRYRVHRRDRQGPARRGPGDARRTRAPARRRDESRHRVETPGENVAAGCGESEVRPVRPVRAVSEQIDLAPSLMSRFDLMFMMSDTPDEERDRDVAEHIVESWDDAAKSAYRGKSNAETVEREVPTEVFQAYIAYAKENIEPVFEDSEVRDRLIDHYVEIRSKGVDEDSAVPVTARKLQAFLRIAEASARARLSDTIEHEDVDRSVKLVMRSLNDVGIDPETGEFDADIVESGTSNSQRQRIKGVKAVIRDVEEEYDDGAPIDVVLERCEAIDIDPDKAQSEIEKLKQKGEVYEPSTDTLRTSS